METIFTLSVTVIVTLTFDLGTLMSIGVIYCPRLKHMLSIKPIGQFVDKLCIGNLMVYRHSDWSTDRHPDI